MRLLASLVVTALVVMSATHASAQTAPLVAGASPGPGGAGLLVVTRNAGAADIVKALGRSSCDVSVVALLRSGTWSIYVSNAPAVVNAQFPKVIEAQTPFFVRCGEGVVALAPPVETPAPGPLPVGTVRRVTYEPGEVREEHAQAAKTGLGVTNEASRTGNYAGFAFLQEKDPRVSSGRRAEWHGGHVAELGHEYTYGISYWIPEDYADHGETKTRDSRIIFQFHEERSTTWSPIYGILLYDDDDGAARLGFYRKMSERGPDNILWSTPLVVDSWIDFVINVKWSPQPDGFVRFYRNGEQVYEALGIATLSAADPPYPKWGVYGQPARLLFDEVRIAEGPVVWDYNP